MNETNATWFSQKVGFDPFHLASCCLVALSFIAAPSKSGDFCLWWLSTLGIPWRTFFFSGTGCLISDNPSDQQCTYVHWSPLIRRTFGYFGLPPLAGGPHYLPRCLSMYVRAEPTGRLVTERGRESSHVTGELVLLSIDATEASWGVV